MGRLASHAMDSFGSAKSYAQNGIRVDCRRMWPSANPFARDPSLLTMAHLIRRLGRSTSPTRRAPQSRRLSIAAAINAAVLNASDLVA